MLPETLIGAAVDVLARHDADREWSVARPDRSVSAVRDASAVPARWRPFEKCVARRESHRNPKARNPRSSAMGTYQFLDHSWRSGLAFMVAARLREHGTTKAQARKVRQWLQRHEIARWPATYQTIGFVAVVSAGGSFHWRLAGSPCEAYR